MLLYNLIEWWGGILPWDREFASPQIAKLAKFRAFANPLKFLRWLHLLMCQHGEWRTEGGEGNTVGRWSYPPEHLTAMNVQEPSSILLKISKVIIFIYASSWSLCQSTQIFKVITFTYVSSWRVANWGRGGYYILGQGWSMSYPPEHLTPMHVHTSIRQSTTIIRWLLYYIH